MTHKGPTSLFFVFHHRILQMNSSISLRQIILQLLVTGFSLGHFTFFKKHFSHRNMRVKSPRRPRLLDLKCLKKKHNIAEFLVKTRNLSRLRPGANVESYNSYNSSPPPSPPDKHALYKDNFATGNGELIADIAVTGPYVGKPTNIALEAAARPTQHRCSTVVRQQKHGQACHLEQELSSLIHCSQSCM